MTVGDPEFRVEWLGDRVAVTGDVDALTCSLVQAELVDPPPGDLRIDLSAVTFIDSSGLRVLLEAHRVVAARGDRLVVVNPSRPTSRLIEVAGLTSHLHVEPALAVADRPA